MNEALKRVDALAAKLGVAAEHLWEVLAKQGYAEGVADLTLSAILFGLMVVSLLVAWKGAKRLDNPNLQESGLALLIPSGVVAAVSLMAWMIHLRSGLVLVMNPEGYAAKIVLGVMDK